VPRPIKKGEATDTGFNPDDSFCLALTVKLPAILNRNYHGELILAEAQLGGKGVAK